MLGSFENDLAYSVGSVSGEEEEESFVELELA
jgi:hypothetical protein